jgi:hypothetical protein
MDDLTISYRDIRDEAIPQKDGTVSRVKRYTFDLGKHGPFIERIPADADQTTELRARVTKLRTHLQAAATL